MSPRRRGLDCDNETLDDWCSVGHPAVSENGRAAPGILMAG